MNDSLRRLVPSLLGIVFLFAAAAVSAQDLDDVTFSGRIADSNNLAVVGATISVTEVTSGTERVVTSNDEGRYRVIELKPGIYKVKATAAGFGAQEKIDIETISGQNVQLDFTLSPADVTASTSVTVSEDDGPVIDTTRTVVGGTVAQRELEELPNTNRNPLDFVFTLGGVSEDPLSVRDVAEDASATGVSEAAGLLEGGLFTL
jgi:hypothetical protein